MEIIFFYNCQFLISNKSIGITEFFRDGSFENILNIKKSDENVQEYIKFQIILSENFLSK